VLEHEEPLPIRHAISAVALQDHRRGGGVRRRNGGGTTGARTSSRAPTRPR
jgi:hypothetical protein